MSYFQGKLHSDTDDGALLHQGYLWKKVSKTLENRYWALLFTDVILLTNVSDSDSFSLPLFQCNAQENERNPIAFMTRVSLLGKQWCPLRRSGPGLNLGHRSITQCKQ